MDKPEPDFTMNEIYQQLQKMVETSEDACTTTELGEALGCSGKTALRYCKKMQKDGLAESTRKHTKDCHGREVTVSAWRWKRPEDGH